jgi:ribosomal protein L11 methyltransferase
VLLILATEEDDLPRARSRLVDLGLSPAEVVAPSDVHRLLLASVDNEPEPGRLVARLRAEGRPAVLRPGGGAPLEGWRRHTRPIDIGGRLTLCFVWSEHDRRGAPNLIELDPDGGFGTGAHPTTALLLEELVARIRGGERVLDVGCGSGVLGLCALRLGAASALGVDIDADAIQATRRNAELNRLGSRMEATLGRLQEVEGVFDVVLANIGRAALVELAPELKARLAPNGWLAVSGISPTQCSLAAALLAPLEVLEQRTTPEWSAVLLVRDRLASPDPLK